MEVDFSMFRKKFKIVLGDFSWSVLVRVRMKDWNRFGRVVGLWVDFVLVGYWGGVK